MNRTSLLIIAATFIVIIAIGFFAFKPVLVSGWQTYQETAKAKQELTDTNKKKEVLTNLAKQNQIPGLYDIAANYIPESQDTGELVIELSAIAGQSNLKVDQVALESGKTATTTKEDTSTAETKAADSATPTQSSTAATEVKFSTTLTGTFPDFLKFLQSLETNSRLITISMMTFTQTTDKFSVQLSGSAYYKKGSTLDKTLANIEVSQKTIDKFKNLKTFGSPINLTTESGFGRTDPFSTY